MRALYTTAIYFGTFVAIGWAAKAGLRRWMDRRGVGLSDVQEQAGANRREREVFLLGAWRKEK